uniref:Uncharacterized protein n=1 Tax=Ditylenchus dipsaci TaxID=166011 RepID=A0A915D821_9BILA
MSLSSGSPREAEGKDMQIKADRSKDASLSSNDANLVTNDENNFSTSVLATHSDFDANTPNAVIVASRLVDSSRCLDAAGTVSKLKSCLKSPVVKYPEKHVQFDHSIDDRSQSEQISSCSRGCGELNANAVICQKSKEASDQIEKVSRIRRLRKKFPTALPSSSSNKRSSPIQDPINVKQLLREEEGIEARKKKISPYSDSRAIRNNQPLQSPIDADIKSNARGPTKFASSSPAIKNTTNGVETFPLVLPCISSSGPFSSSAPNLQEAYNAEKKISHGLTYASLQVLLEKVSETSATPTTAGTSLTPNKMTNSPGCEEEDSKLNSNDIMKEPPASHKKRKLAGNIQEEPRRSQRIRARSQVAISAVETQKIVSGDAESRHSNDV